jgi:hypothetical protein
MSNKTLGKRLTDVIEKGIRGELAHADAVEQINQAIADANAPVGRYRQQEALRADCNKLLTALEMARQGDTANKDYVTTEHLEMLSRDAQELEG